MTVAKATKLDELREPEFLKQTAVQKRIKINSFVSFFFQEFRIQNSSILFICFEHSFTLGAYEHEKRKKEKA